MYMCFFEQGLILLFKAVFEFTVIPLPELPEYWVTGESHPAQHSKFLKMSDCVSSSMLPFYLSGVFPIAREKGHNRDIYTVLLLISW